MWLLKGGRVLCPASRVDGPLDVRVAGGRVVEIGHALPAGDAEVIDCAGAVVVPAFVDLASELCDPGMTWREDLRTGSLAAAAGGYGIVVASPATDPVVDCASVASDVLARAASAPGAEIRLAGALTVGLAGRELAELNDLAEAGCIAFSDGGRALSDPLVLRNALDYARPVGRIVLLRPGEPALEERGCMHEGPTSTLLGLHGIPAASEEIGVARAIVLARLTGVRVHLSPVTTARAASMIAAAQQEGLPVSGAVPARSLLLTDQAVDTSFYDTATRLLPPLRPESDRAAMVAAVRVGVLSIAADHVPLTRVEKEHEFALATPGAVGLETAFSAALTALGDLAAAVFALAVAPGRLLGLDPRVAVGARADLAILVPDEDRDVVLPRFSRGCNEPLVGQTLRGQVRGTLVRGRPVFGPGSGVIG